MTGGRPPHPAYPAAPDSRVALREAAARGGGPVAARLHLVRAGALLTDESSVVELASPPAGCCEGDLVAGLLAGEPGAWTLRDSRVLAPARRELAPELVRLAARRPALRARGDVLAAVRAYFAREAFLEVETPARVANPGLEVHLAAFPAGQAPGHEPRWLITSPELHLKRFLAAGYERVFEIARAFRDDEAGHLHAPEFALLEWYRAYRRLDALAADLAALLAAVDAATSAAAGAPARFGGCDVHARFQERTHLSLFREHAGVDPEMLEGEARDRVFVERVEPRLGLAAPLLLTEFPADAAALARLVPSSDAEAGGRLVAARMELYVGGVELANGFDELNDPEEQRARHEQDRARRAALGRPAYPLDEGFLTGLEAGSPPAAGMALGLDRLVMLAVGASSIRDVRAFDAP